MKILQRYILSELAGPFAFSLGLLTFILFMRHMVFLFPKIAAKGLGWDIVAEVMLLSLPFIIALVVPMAVLVAVIMAFGRLSADNEIVSLGSMGVSVGRLMAVPMAAAVAVMFAMVWFNDQVLPESNHRYKGLLTDIAYLKPTAALQEGVIMDRFPGMRLLVTRLAGQDSRKRLDPTVPGELVPSGSRAKEDAASMFGIIISETGQANIQRTIVADSGYIRYLAGREDALLVLFHGEIQEADSRKQEQFQRTFFQRHQIRLPGLVRSLKRGRGRSYRSDRELSRQMILERVAVRRAELDSLWAEGAALIESLEPGDSAAAALKERFGQDPLAGLKALRNVPESLVRIEPARRIRLQDDPRLQLGSVLKEASFTRRRVNALEVEFWKKISIPFSSLIFVLVGVPLGILTRRSGMGLAIAISMGIFLVYWVALIAGETLADRMLLSPFWAMWTPNAIFLVLGAWLLWVQVHGLRTPVLSRAGRPKPAAPEREEAGA